MLVTWPLVILLGYTARVAHAFSGGAPAARCDNMVPAHTANQNVILPQSTPLPYSFQFSKFTYSTGEGIQMRLAGERGATFRGLLVKVITEQGMAVGTMIPPQGYKTVTCGFSGNEALTHTEKSDKPGIVFTWIAPSTSYGTLTVRLTVVYNYGTFWVNERIASLVPDTTVSSLVSTTVSPPLTSVPVLITTLPTTLTSQPEAPEPPTISKSTESPAMTSSKPSVEVVSAQQSGKIQYDPQCGAAKGCFSDCKGNDCNFLVMWRDIGQAVTFELQGKPKTSESWIAIGLSRDNRMGSDSVTECVNNGGIVQVYNSFNYGYSNKRISQFGLRDVSGSYNNGVFRCRFTRIKWNETHPYMFNLNQNWKIMFAHGNALPGFMMSMHSVDADELPAVSASQIDFQTVLASTAVTVPTSKFTLVKIHGCLMIVAWVLFVGVGITTARYYKGVWADKTIMNLKIWFQIHRVCMVTALALNIIAFIIIFVAIKGYSQIPDLPGKSYLRSHPVLGIIITVLVIANPVMALFRPGPDHDKRPIFNWAHWGVGVTAYILSALCICFGFELGKASTPDYAVYIMIGYILYVVLFDIACEVHDYLERKEKKAKTDAIEMKTQNGTDSVIPNGNHSTKEKKKKSDKLKTLLLAVHIAFTGAFALVLVLVVALN